MTTPTTVNVRLQLRADTAANWTAANPILLANEVGLETDTKKLKVGNGSSAWNSLAYFPSIVSGGTVLGNLEIGSTGTLTFEGSTADGFETTLAVTNPTADRTITLPNQSGTVVVSGNASIVDADIAANAEIAVSKLADGAARQLLQTDAAGTGVEWTSNVDIPGTLDVTGAATFDGAVTVAGDLTVNGTTTNINTQNLVVEDKNIILGDVATPSDTTADGGGITLKGATDKTINWVDSTDAWTSSERFSVPMGSAASPSLTFTGDPNTGIYSSGADQVAISTGGSGRLFVDASGNVSVGASSSDGLLHANGGTIISTRAAAFGTTILRRAEGSIASPAAISASVELGRVSYRGYDGASYQQVATIGGFSDGAVTSASAPGYLEFYTTPSGSVGPVPRLRITSAGLVGVGTSSPDQFLTCRLDQDAATTFKLSNENTGANSQCIVQLRNGASSSVFLRASSSGSYFQTLGSSITTQYQDFDTHIWRNNAGTERARIDSSGRLLVGTSTSTALLGYNSGAQFATNTGTVSFIRNTADNGSPELVAAKSRGSTASPAIVSNGDGLWLERFAGYDGSNYIEAARITAAVDGTPGANDMPGRLVFSTTADGASSPTERMRIKNNGTINFSNVAVYADNAAATTGGLAVGDVYRTSTGQLMIRY